MFRSLRTVLNPAMYHGHGERPPFFEGWYYKIVDRSETHRYAVIPGIFLSDDPGKHHAFVQVLNGRTGQATYHRYAPVDFWASKGELDLQVGPNRFTDAHMALDIESPELALRGELSFESVTPWPVTLTSPGIMGWYAWVPFMETYHGVVSLDHGIGGTLAVDGETLDFSGGRGYIEKDWGRSFPSSWIWYQTNHFDRPGTSLTASLAIIPWIRRSFPGFIVGLWHNAVLYRFATYTGARIQELDINGKEIRLAVQDKAHRLAMIARRAGGSLLHAPTTVDMGRRITETLDATIEVQLLEIDGGRRHRLFEGTGRNSGLEAAGDLERLKEMWRSEQLAD
jgi:hypothetical protein